MKQKRWWLILIVGGFLFLVAKSLVSRGGTGIDDPLPWLVGMIPFVVMILGRQLYCRATGITVPDEDLRFFGRAWNTTLLVYIFLETTFYFRFLVIAVFGNPLYIVFGYNFTLVHLFTAVVHSMFGFLIAGTLRILFWPRSISLRGFLMVIVGILVSTCLFQLLVFEIPLNR